MRQTDDTGRGEWIRARLHDWSTILGVVPDGFEAYARVFHPVDAPWSVPPASRQVDSAESATLGWAEVAAGAGTVSHPLMQWRSIAPASAGPDRQYGEPASGWLPSPTLGEVVGVLRRHTSTPDVGTAALWDGFGWLHGADADSLAVATDATDPGEVADLLAGARRRASRDPLPDTGSRLSLPDRDYLLFDTDLAELTRPDWSDSARWDRDSSPNLLWPDDRAWMLATEIDFDSTLVGGTRAMVDDLLAASGLEVMEVPPGASLQWDADTINGPPATPY